MLGYCCVIVWTKRLLQTFMLLFTMRATPTWYRQVGGDAYSARQCRTLRRLLMRSQIANQWKADFILSDLRAQVVWKGLGQPIKDTQQALASVVGHIMAVKPVTCRANAR
jgi:hypothetical protein